MEMCKADLWVTLKKQEPGKQKAEHWNPLQIETLESYLIIICVVLCIMLLQELSLAAFLFQSLANQLCNLAHLAWFFSANYKPRQDTIEEMITPIVLQKFFIFTCV